MDSTPIFGLGIPSADGSDGADLAALLRTLGLDVEGKAGGITAMTSAARAALTGAGKYEGRVVHETDTDTLWRSDGTTWRQLVLFDSSGNLPMGGKKVTGLAAAAANGDAVRYEQLGQVGDAVAALGQWAAWTCAVTASTTNPTGVTQVGSAWTRVGNLATVRGAVTIPLATKGSGTYYFSLPVNMASVYASNLGLLPLGFANKGDTEAIFALPQSASTVYLRIGTAGSAMGSDWVTGDDRTFSFQITYEAA